ncbi:MAG TPA: hypothetical protein VGB18_06925 [Candidatus Thermoplasmatota archaeon]
MALTIRYSQIAAAIITRLPGIDQRIIRKVVRELAKEPGALERHPHGVVVEEAPDGMRLHVFVIGDWKLIIVIDEGDLVVFDVRPWDSGPI